MSCLQVAYVHTRLSSVIGAELELQQPVDLQGPGA